MITSAGLSYFPCCCFITFLLLLWIYNLQNDVLIVIQYIDILYGLQYRYTHLNVNDICLKLCKHTAFTIFI